jgi:hypothetical protein
MIKIVGIYGILTKDGEPDIDLLIYPLHDDGSASPYVAVTDFVSKEITGGAIKSLDQAFDDEVRKHQGYKVQKCLTLKQKTSP